MLAFSLNQQRTPGTNKRLKTFKKFNGHRDGAHFVAPPPPPLNVCFFVGCFIISRPLSPPNVALGESSEAAFKEVALQKGWGKGMHNKFPASVMVFKWKVLG